MMCTRCLVIGADIVHFCTISFQCMASIKEREDNYDTKRAQSSTYWKNGVLETAISPFGLPFRMGGPYYHYVGALEVGHLWHPLDFVEKPL